MDKITKLQKHIKENPTDYQAVIALMQAKSDAIDRKMYEKRIDAIKKVAHYRRLRREKQIIE